MSALALLLRLHFSNQSPFFNLIALISGAGSIVLGIIHYRLNRPPPQFDRNRVLELVQRWVNDRLDSALADVLYVELDLITCPDALTRTYNDQEPLQAVQHLLPAGTKVSSLFDESGGALLILGNPGSGKTTLLFQLARELITRAERGTRLPIPIIFKLSSWDNQQLQERQPSFAEWLIHELHEQYNIPHQLAQFMIETDQVLLLLDSLDDVRMLERRIICAKAINAFRTQKFLTPLVVSCRTMEYEDIQIKLKLEKAVKVRPLTHEKIQDYLAYFGDSHIGLRAALVRDPVLGELATVPLILSIMAQVYPNMPEPVLETNSGDGKTGLIALRKQLFDAYIDKRLEWRASVPREQMRSWLVALARGMLQNAQTVFLIEHLQPSWLASSRDRVWYVLLDRVGSGLVAALMVGIVIGLSYGLSGGIVAGLANGARWGLAACLVVGLLGCTREDNGQTESVDRSLVYRALLGTLIFGALGGAFAKLYLPLLNWLPDVNLGDITYRIMLADVFFFALVGAFGSALLHGPSLRPRIVRVMEKRYWSWLRGLPIGLAIGIAVALVSTYVYSLSTHNRESVVFGLVYGLSTWIILGLVTGEVESIAGPNQRIRRTIRSAVWVGLASGLVSGLGSILSGFAIGDPQFGFVYGISSAMLVGLFGAMVSGGYACLSHLALRVVLWRSGMLPWYLTVFLDDAAKRILLRRAGGGYEFIHSLLLEHIANMQPSTVIKHYDTPHISDHGLR